MRLTSQRMRSAALLLCRRGSTRPLFQQDAARRRDGNAIRYNRMLQRAAVQPYALRHATLAECATQAPDGSGRHILLCQPLQGRFGEPRCDTRRSRDEIGNAAKEGAGKDLRIMISAIEGIPGNQHSTPRNLLHQHCRFSLASRHIQRNDVPAPDGTIELCKNIRSHNQGSRWSL
jgi:hypothetical protein